MINTEEIYNKLIGLLDKNKAEYKLFNHREALTYQDLEAVQREAGFFGTEMKCMVLKVDDNFIVYITLQGNKIDFGKIKDKLEIRKIRLATPEELNEFFGAQPGCAYPFGFSEQYNIYVDPMIYQQEWLLFSPVFPTKTIQVRGSNLKKVLDNVDNKVFEVNDFNQ